MSLLNIIAATATSAAAEQNPLYSFATILLPIGILVVMWAILIRPQKKREKKQEAERAAIAVGDGVITIGGLSGKVVNIKDDDITIATSVAQTLVTFRRDAISAVKKPESADI